MARTEKTIQQKKPLQTSETWEELKETEIKKLHAQIDFSTNKMVNCHIPMQTLIAEVEKFKGSNVTNCLEEMGKYYTRSVCFKYSQVWFNNGICQNTSVSVCTTPEFLSDGKIIDAEISKLVSKGVYNFKHY